LQRRKIAVETCTLRVAYVIEPFQIQVHDVIG
jgi:hypothetical protein